MLQALEVWLARLVPFALRTKPAAARSFSTAALRGSIERGRARQQKLWTFRELSALRAHWQLGAPAGRQKLFRAKVTLYVAGIARHCRAQPHTAHLTAGFFLWCALMRRPRGAIILLNGSHGNYAAGLSSNRHGCRARSHVSCTLRTRVFCQFLFLRAASKNASAPAAASASQASRPPSCFRA